MRRSQVTAFMLLGLVLVSVFGFSFFMTKSISEQKLQKEIEMAANDVMQDIPIESYVTECLDKAFRQAILLIGQQGGTIHYSQPGSSLNSTFVLPSTVLYGEENITYLIKPIPSRNSLDKFSVMYSGKYSDLPGYPCFGSTPENQTNHCYYIADTTADEYVYGGWWMFDLDERYRAKVSEPEYQNVIIPSWKRQIESYVEHNVKECVNFSVVGEVLGYNISDGDVTANVTITAGTKVAVRIDYPVVITVRGGQPVTRISSFYGDERIRLRDIYKFISKIIEADAKYVEFNLSGVAASNNIFYNLSNADFKVIYQDGYDIIKLFDHESSMLGEEYEFWFARQNRPPALDYVYGGDESNYEPGSGSRYKLNTPSGKSYLFDYVIKANVELKVDPLAHDPDEDSIVYNYSAWQETYYEWFNASAFNDLNCSNELFACVVRNNTYKPHNWTSSASCYGDGCEVHYNLSDLDLGAHILNVTVDDGKTRDWQEVRIMVIESPTAEARGNNSFGDIDNSFASIEDLYWLDARGSGGYFCQIYYDYQDASENTTWNSLVYNAVTGHTLYSGEHTLIGLFSRPCPYPCLITNISNSNAHFLSLSCAKIPSIDFIVISRPPNPATKLPMLSGAWLWPQNDALISVATGGNAPNETALSNTPTLLTCCRAFLTRS